VKRAGARRATGRSAARNGAAIAAMVLALAACAPQPEPPPEPPPPAPVAVPPPPAGQSAALAAYYARVEAGLRARGLMRTDGGGPDTPFGPRELAETFVRIALYDEYTNVAGSFVRRETPAPLRRWAAPVRIGLRFGASVGQAERERDRAAVAALADRLARVTGHPIRLSEAEANFWVYVVGEAERRALGPEWAVLFPGVQPADLTVATGMDLGTFCLVLAISEPGTAVYAGALAVIRAELPDGLRLSCLHEEIAQGLGLGNDSPRARPSIFNDDEEFALLTRLDEKMLRILYDPRLRPGMREAEARPIVATIAAELLAGTS
jgi:hypothetical protein